MVALAGGKHFSAATISFVRGGEGFAFVTLTLKQVFFTAQNVNLSSGGTMEAVKLNFATLQLSVASQKPDGSLNPPVQGGWDLLQNKPL